LTRLIITPACDWAVNCCILLIYWYMKSVWYILNNSYFVAQFAIIQRSHLPDSIPTSNRTPFFLKLSCNHGSFVTTESRVPFLSYVGAISTQSTFPESSKKHEQAPMKVMNNAVGVSHVSCINRLAWHWYQQIFREKFWNSVFVRKLTKFWELEISGGKSGSAVNRGAVNRGFTVYGRLTYNIVFSIKGYAL
jgi:hypothetical protein